LMVALLALFQLLILTVGTLLCFVGLLAAAPFTDCISTAAYRQLFKDETDRSVALSNANYIKRFAIALANPATNELVSKQQLSGDGACGPQVGPPPAQ
jgi:S-methylmethionine-dependent homocysteine/selenocysteine methylase